MTSGSPGEIVYLLDSVNRVPCVTEDLSNPTADITIETKLSINRLAVHKIELATLEVPRSQKLIEDDWSRVYSFSGLALPPATQPYVLTLQSCDTKMELTLPGSVIKIDRVTNVGGNQVEFHTVSPHLLQTFAAHWPSPQPIEILGLEAVQPVSQPTIVDEQTFRLNVTSPVTNPSTASLFYPPIASPDGVASVLNKALQQFDVGEWFSFSYNKHRSRLQLSGSCAGRLRVGGNNNNSLGVFLGFVGQDKILCPGGTVEAENPLYGTSFFTLPTGNYSSSGLATMLGEGCAANVFPPAAVTLTKKSDIPADLYHLSVGTNDGSVVRVNVPAGTYTPYSLADTVSALLPQGISLRYDAASNKLIFESVTQFSLEFQTDALTNINLKLGFASFRYANQTSYTSNLPFNASPLLGNKQFDLTSCSVNNNQLDHTFSFAVSGDSPLPITGNELLPPDVIQNVQQGHGLQVGDVVQISVAHQTVHVPVTEVLSGLSFRVDFGSSNLPSPLKWTATSITGSSEVTIAGLPAIPWLQVGDQLMVGQFLGTVTEISPALKVDLSPNTWSGSDLTVAAAMAVRGTRQPTQSILMSPNLPCAVKPHILGFPPHDLLWDGSEVLTSPYQYHLLATTYILVQLLIPSCGTFKLEHRFKTDNLTNILGKIVLLNNPFLSRYYPMEVVFCSNVRLTKLRIRLLNDDHTLYKLHGLDWRATLRLILPKPRVPCVGVCQL